MFLIDYYILLGDPIYDMNFYFGTYRFINSISFNQVTP